VADALEPLLDHESTKRAEMVRELARVRDSLGTPGAARRVATMALELAASTPRGRAHVGAAR
jgi:hypothetical protein